MQFNYQLSLEAENDILESYVWYENQQVGLGERFLQVLDEAKEAILANPISYRIIFKKKIRAYHLAGFPFSIYYSIEGNELNVLSVFHMARHPQEWKKRT